MAVDTSVSNQIYLSRDQIRTQIIEYIQYYMELENVDLTKSSFLSFIINILSTLTSNILFYETSVYREFFLTKAQLPESILNLSAFLGYNTKEASFSAAEVLMTIPLGFEDVNTTFYIPEKFKFKAGDVEFLTYYSTAINVLNNETITITVTEGTKTYNLAVDVDFTVPEFSFVMPIRQYKISEQEFQIDGDLQLYQFTTIDVPLSGKVSTMLVQIQDPGSAAWTTYTEFSSLYLMSSTDYGYVSRRISTGRTLYFGNGLIGVQPTPGATVKVTVYETEGESGNVIATSINTGDRIYTTTSAGLTKIVNYTCSNTSPAAGGEDEESIEDIRSNSIKNLVSLGRLVSEIDYQNTDVVIPYSPFKTAPLPVLKRSDINCNEIQLYSNLLFGDDLVPTRNESLEVDLSTSSVPRGTIISSGGEDFSTLFDMTIDHLNGAAYYDYIMYEIILTPTLQTTYDPVYNSILLQSLYVSLDTTTESALFKLTYTGTDLVASCKLEVLKTGQSLIMSHDTVNKYFSYSFTPYTSFPEGDVILNFTVSSGTTQVYTYAITVTFRKSLNDFMMSNVIDSTSCIIYDIPVVQTNYYNSIVKRDFEIQVLQYMMSSLTFSDYKMITDFVNVKFTNTTGSMKNMQHNPVTKSSVLSLTQTNVPVALSGDRYIVNGTEGGIWTDQKNKIAQCTDSTAQIWYFFTPTMNDMIYVIDEEKKYIFTGSQWFLPEYNIPLKLEVEVFKSDTYLGSSAELINSIKTNIIDEFKDRFGSNISLYKSEIIKVVQETEGVGHCNLIKPESNIFFDFDIDDFTQTELLSYSPEYVYFMESDITVKILG